MSKLLNKPIKVICETTLPSYLYWENKSLKVEHILECWYDTGCWWEMESEKIFYRLICQSGVVLEIFKDCSSSNWFVYKVYD